MQWLEQCNTIELCQLISFILYTYTMVYGTHTYGMVYGAYTVLGEITTKLLIDCINVLYSLEGT